MRIFITGGNGFIGSRVVARLHDLGHELRCLLRPRSDHRRIAGIPVTTVTGTLDDVGAVETGLDGADACIHLASPSAWHDIASDDLEDVIVGGTRRLVVAASRRDGLRFVYVSSAAAINASATPQLHDENSPFTLAGSGLRYAIAKHHAEQVVLGHEELDSVIVNPGEVYGPNDTGWVTAGALRDTLRQRPALAVAGGVSVAHVDDVAAGLIAALEKGRRGQRYILGGTNLTIEEIVRLTLQCAGRRAPVVVVPSRLARRVVRTCERLRVRPPIEPDLLDYASRFWFMDSGKARSELGYTSRNATATIAEVVDWIVSTTRTEGIAS